MIDLGLARLARLAHAARKKKLQLEVPHPASDMLPVNVALDPGSLKLPTKFMNRGGVAFSLPIPISLHAVLHLLLRTLAWRRLLDYLPTQLSPAT